MKRIQLFEWEDFQWFPHILRMSLTHYLVSLHRLLDSPATLAPLLTKGLSKTKHNRIIDLCSGGGGPMLAARDILEQQQGSKDLKLTLTDLYPNTTAAKLVNNLDNPNIEYLHTPIDATNVGAEHQGLRTMICSLHHLPPNLAKAVLKNAKDNRQPYLAYEISDNSFPFFLWWLAFPTTFISVFLLTPFIRPLTWHQLFFTYIIPILPFFIAWDGAVSNARTYTLEDLDIILKDLQSDDYTWEKGIIKGKGVPKIYLLGYPNI